MNINIITVGNLKEKYWVDAVGEYQKRISKFCNLTITEIKEQNISDANLINLALQKEAEDILKRLKGYVVIMDIQGKSISSTELADKVTEITNNGNSTITFVIGSSFGLSEKVKEKADLKLSFSKLTFPHQLFRVMLLEQIYRAFSINNNIKYHK